MITKNIEHEIKNLFLKKKYKEVIKISEKYTIPPGFNNLSTPRPIQSVFFF